MPVNELLWRLFARSVYWPSLAFELACCRCLGRWKWWDEIDEGLILGGRPFRSQIQSLYQLGVRAVVNNCEEYYGPVDEYARLGIDQLHLPTVDYTSPTYEQVLAAIDFIERHRCAGHVVHVHCKAGRGRGATIALCWLIYRRGICPADAQKWLRQRRRQVNEKLYLRPVVQKFWEQGGWRTQPITAAELAPEDSIPAWFDPRLIEDFRRKIHRRKNGLHLLDPLVFRILDVCRREPMWTRTHDWQELESFIESDCQEIRGAGFAPDIIIGIKSGGAFIGNYVARCLDVEEVAYVDVDHYSPLVGSTVIAFLARVGRKAILRSGDAIDLAGRRVLLVDDQICTGQSMKAAKDWAIRRGAKEIKTYCVYVQQAQPDFGRRKGIMMYAPWGDDP